MKTDPQITEQIVELESRLAFQEHNITELNEIITDQQAQIDRLLATVEGLDARLSLMAADGAGGAGARPEDEVPPHY